MRLQKKHAIILSCCFLLLTAALLMFTRGGPVMANARAVAVLGTYPVPLDNLGESHETRLPEDLPELTALDQIFIEQHSNGVRFHVDSDRVLLIDGDNYAYCLSVETGWSWSRFWCLSLWGTETSGAFYYDCNFADACGPMQTLQSTYDNNRTFDCRGGSYDETGKLLSRGEVLEPRCNLPAAVRYWQAIGLPQASAEGFDRFVNQFVTGCWNRHPEQAAEVWRVAHQLWYEYSLLAAERSDGAVSLIRWPVSLAVSQMVIDPNGHFGNARSDGTVHDGADINFGTQTFSIYPTMSGRVLWHGWDPSGGWCVRLEHDPILGLPKSQSLYCHLYADPYLQVGQEVDIHTPIGQIGPVTSGVSTGIHLHFGLSFWDGQSYTAVDPEDFVGLVEPDMTYTK